MADPILNMAELNRGDSVGYLEQNNRNLVSDWLAFGGKVVSNASTAPLDAIAPLYLPAARGQAWILAGSGTAMWAGQAAGTIAIALSDNPTSVRGWHFLVPTHGTMVWVVAGSPSGHLTWNGSAWTPV